MSYTPTQWQTGDVVTAEKLNKIESAIEECSSNVSSVSGLVEASMDPETNIVTLNKSFSDLFAIIQARVVPFLVVFEDSGVYCGNLGALIHRDDMYGAQFAVPPNIMTFVSSDPNNFMTILENQSDNNEDSPQS